MGMHVATYKSKSPCDSRNCAKGFIQLYAVLWRSIFGFSLRCFISRQLLKNFINSTLCSFIRHFMRCLPPRLDVVSFIYMKLYLVLIELGYLVLIELAYLLL